MDFVKQGRAAALLLIMLAGCGNIMDDLDPSSSDKRPAVEAGSIGPAVGQNAPDFTISDTLGSSLNLSTELTGTTVKAVVLYFTMWCPVCDTHMTHMHDAIIPAFPEVVFCAVDYVSGSVAESRSAETENGYAGSGFRVLADVDSHVLNAYQATMGTTVVIDKSGVILMNEDFRDGARLQAVLSDLR